MHDQDFNPQDPEAIHKNSKKIRKSRSINIHPKAKPKRKIPGEPK